MLTCKDCYQICGYAPREEGEIEWVYDEKGIKRRKNPKTLRCAYNNRTLDWDIPCPWWNAHENASINDKVIDKNCE